MFNFSFRSCVICAFASVLLLGSCNNTAPIKESRVLEIAKHLPDPEHLDKSKGYLTDDYYDVLEEMINLPEVTPVLHQWEFWFVSGDGNLLAQDECEVLEINQMSKTKATAPVSFTPADPEYFEEEYLLIFKKVNGKWLLNDFDGTKKASHDYIETYWKEIAPKAH